MQYIQLYDKSMKQNIDKAKIGRFLNFYIAPLKNWKRSAQRIGEWCYAFDPKTMSWKEEYNVDANSLFIAREHVESELNVKSFIY